MNWEEFQSHGNFVHTTEFLTIQMMLQPYSPDAN